VLLGGQITPKHTLRIRSRHQVGIGRAAETPSTARSIVEVRSEPVEIVIDIFDSSEIVFRERKAMFLREMVLDCLQIVRVQHVAGERFLKSCEYLLNGRLRSKSFRTFLRD